MHFHVRFMHFLENHIANFKHFLRLTRERQMENNTIQPTLSSPTETYTINKKLVELFDWKGAGFIHVLLLEEFMSSGSDGWFTCKREKLIGYHFSKSYIIRIKKLLVAADILKIKRVGNPSVESYKINRCSLYNILDERRCNTIKKYDSPICHEHQLSQNMTASCHETRQLKKYTKKVNQPLQTAALDISNKETASTRVRTCAYARKILNTNTNTKTKDKDTNVIFDNILSYLPEILNNESLNNETEKIINYWNTLPMVVKHQQNGNTKTIQLSKELLASLLQGLPILKTKMNQPRKELITFFQKYDIDLKLLRKKWSVQEITDILGKAIQFKNEQGNTLKISLPNVIWNEFSSKNDDGTKSAFSWFYYVLLMDATPHEYVEMAKKLGSIVRITQYAVIMEWAYNLKYFGNKQSISVEEMQSTIDWYTKHHNDEFVPKSRDIREFIRKYEGIKMAINRQKYNKKQVSNRLVLDKKTPIYLADGTLVKDDE